MEASPALTPAPELASERLILRGPRREDLSEFTRFVTSAPSMIAQGEAGTAADAWYAFLAGIGHWQWHGFGFFILEERATGRSVGRVGLLKHVSWPETELAWHLYEGAEGKGYATEAGRVVRDWAAAHLGVAQLYSFIDVNNTRSQAVARRLQATTDGTRAAHDPEAEVWVHPRQAD
ncbi:GNAT family N-acetyltransferase [Gymnodinialimonas ceratoperidinii]|uniref:GNAT family N-acetyltransferase n=2 Tax=Gymnodinialimonas ceratoperidinii TaxID=2856823 RepID=A0A8F6YBW9_9RHOB|nr:GNAT family N-acetyltransferase [Gymnodinialimonas ceratoperidinii]